MADNIERNNSDHLNDESDANSDRSEQSPHKQCSQPITISAPDDDDDETVTMVDVLKEEEELEENAFAVLANSDDKHCTYLKGYVSRQALYACNTCVTRDGESAGICLACSYKCHDGHELFELYTKRNFRCDCGNDKFLDNDCKLYKKTGVNDRNSYNQNFAGNYCTCKRPYPDPDNDTEDEMIQCVVCEDWYHQRHLIGEVPENSDFAEIICDTCMSKLPFLWFYYLSYKQILENERTEKSSQEKSGEKLESQNSDIIECDSGIESSCDSAMSLTPSGSCKLSALKESWKQSEKAMATFWPLEWRTSLCKCCECVSMYNRNNCTFLVNEKDMVHYYESQAMQEHTKVSHYDKGISEFQKFNRTQQIEYMSGYNDLRDELRDYLKKFAESKKVVREEDIKEFFEDMKARKRQRVDIPFNCK